MPTDSPISFCTTLSPSPANLWMHLNLLPRHGNILDCVRVLHLQEAFHFFHCDNLETNFLLFHTRIFTLSGGRNWRKWITKIGKQLSLKLNEQQSENFSSSFLMDSSGKLYVWLQFWRFIKFFSAFLEITKSHSQSFFVIHWEKPFSGEDIL